MTDFTVTNVFDLSDDDDEQLLPTRWPGSGWADRLTVFIDTTASRRRLAGSAASSEDAGFNYFGHVVGNGISETQFEQALLSSLWLQDRNLHARLAFQAIGPEPTRRTVVAAPSRTTSARRPLTKPLLWLWTSLVLIAAIWGTASGVSIASGHGIAPATVILGFLCTGILATTLFKLSAGEG